MPRSRSITWRPVQPESPREEIDFRFVVPEAIRSLERNRIGQYIDKPIARRAAQPVHPLEKGLLRSLRIVGIPTAPGTPEEEALTLLEVAAELEHALMVEYLYAFFSCETLSLGGLLRPIALQEMGHLLTVQNLRLLLGGTPYIGRQDQSPQPDQDPFPFRLEPVSLDSLAKYAVCEMPAEHLIPSGMQDIVHEIRARAESTLGTAIHRVGALYTKIYWLFMSDDTSVGSWRSFPAEVFTINEPDRHIRHFSGVGSLSFQADSAEWAIGGYGINIDVCQDREAAMEALHRIAAQGEGLSSEVDSHFELFVKAYENCKANDVRIYPVPVAPTTDATKPGTLLVNPVAARLSELLDSSYELLITEVLLSLTIDKVGPHAARRQELIDESLRGMRTCIKRIANHLAARVPLQPGLPAGATPRAGGAFMAPGMPAGNPAQLIQFYHSAITRFEQRIEAVGAQPGLEGVVRTWLHQFKAQATAKRRLAQAITSETMDHH